MLSEFSQQEKVPADSTSNDLQRNKTRDLILTKEGKFFSFDFEMERIKWFIEICGAERVGGIEVTLTQKVWGVWWWSRYSNVIYQNMKVKVIVIMLPKLH